MKSISKILVTLCFIQLFVLAVFAVPEAVTVFDASLEGDYIPYDNGWELNEEGTEKDAIVISTADEFNNYAALILSDNASYSVKYYKLGSNIDFDGKELLPFGTADKPFRGTLDGSGYAIENVGIYDVESFGVVGYMTMGTIKNLKVSYADFAERKNFSSLKYFGGIAGKIAVDSGKRIDIYGCQTEGDLLISTKGALYGGGVLGAVNCNNASAYINDCTSLVSIDAVTAKSHYASGFAAYVLGGSDTSFFFKNCICYGDISVNGNYLESTVGGFAGYVKKDAEDWSGWTSEDEEELFAEIKYGFENCVSFSDVYGKSNKYAYVGGFVAKIGGEGTVNSKNIYYPESCSVVGESLYVITENKGTKASDELLLSKSFYEETFGFDFGNDWYFDNATQSVMPRSTVLSLGGGVVLDEKSVRLEKNYSGLRFKVDLELSKRDYAFEYGVIIARKDELCDNDLTFDFEGRKVIGVAFDSTRDIYLEKDDEKVTFTAVAYNIPKENYGTELVARSYLKFVLDGEQVVVYGNTQSSSINISALEVRNSESYETLTDSQKMLLETMLPKA